MPLHLHQRGYLETGLTRGIAQDGRPHVGDLARAVHFLAGVFVPAPLQTRSLTAGNPRQHLWQNEVDDLLRCEAVVIGQTKEMELEMEALRTFNTLSR